MATASQGPSQPAVGDAPIRHWKVIKPSVFKPLLATVERNLVRRRLGHLEPEDSRALRELLPTILGR